MTDETARRPNLWARYVCSVLAVLVVAAPAWGAAKPKPWMWDTKTAAREIVRANLSPLGRETPSRLTVRCVGKGKQVARRYTSFQCAGTLKLFVKVRRAGRGQACASLTSFAAVPRACLNPSGTRVLGDRDDARNILRAELKELYQTSVPYQGPTDCAGFGAGFFTCWFGADPSDPAAGTANVVLVVGAPVVTVTRMPPAG